MWKVGVLYGMPALLSLVGDSGAPLVRLEGRVGDLIASDSTCSGTPESENLLKSLLVVQHSWIL